MLKVGDYVPFLKSGKFPTLTSSDLRLVLDRYLLTKVGPFPDCFERLAEHFLQKGNDVSALVTCERAVSVFYGCIILSIVLYYIYYILLSILYTRLLKTVYDNY